MPCIPRAVLCAALVVVFNPMIAARAASPWNDVGASARPDWVHPKTERRLRLLSALPGIKSALHDKANAYFHSGGPGLAVGLVLEDGLYYSQGFGFADKEKTKTPDEYTVYRSGSLSKVITATGLMTMVDDPNRNVSLDDLADETRYLPELKFVCPKFNQPCDRGSQHNGITLRHLVSHTAGLADAMEVMNSKTPGWLTDLKKSWLLFEPGKFGAYSGVGMEGVGLIESRVAGKSFAAFIKSDLFDPLGMTSSSMDPLDSLPHRAALWQLNFFGKSWFFSFVKSPLDPDDQTMILPAGGFMTSVHDMALFMRMWLSGQAPEKDGRPILKSTTIADATHSMFSSTAAPPDSCKGGDGRTDKHDFFYSPCGTAFGFGAGWYVGETPFVEHNGAIGVSGSNTRIDQSKKMGVTGLVSTEPFPTANPQPEGLDNSFMNDIVYGTLETGEAADGKAKSWQGKALADGVARVLFLSGKTVTPDDLDHFIPSYAAREKLNRGNIKSYLLKWRQGIGKCGKFRIRSVEDATSIFVRFNCEKDSWDASLHVESAVPHRISWSYQPPPPPPPPNLIQCLQKCTTAEGQCVLRAHDSDQRQACILEQSECRAECRSP